MRRSVIRILAVYSLILLFLISNIAPLEPVQAYYGFTFGQAYWGTPGEKAIQAYPGGRNVPLTVTIINQIINTTGAYTVNGIRAYLYLPTYFTDVNNSTTAYAAYSSTDGVPPGGSFTLTFYLNIADNAPWGTYSANIGLDYLTTKRDGTVVPPKGDTKGVGMLITLSPKIPVSPAFTIATSGQTLVGGRAETLTIRMTNGFPYNLTEIYANFTIPTLKGITESTPPIAILSSYNWYIPNLPSQSSIELKVQIFAPSTNLGSVYNGLLTVKYRDNQLGQTRTENYPIGLVIQGYVEMTVYGVAATPTVASPGSTVTVTATLLNKGNAGAYFANVTAIPSNIFILIPDSTVYVGDVASNSPTPFSLSVRISPRAGNGTYQLPLQVAYEDAVGQKKTFKFTAEVKVSTKLAEGELPEARRAPQQGINWGLIATVAGVAVAAALIVAATIVYRRRSKLPEEAKEKREEEEKISWIQRLWRRLIKGY